MRSQYQTMLHCECVLSTTRGVGLQQHFSLQLTQPKNLIEAICFDIPAMLNRSKFAQIYYFCSSAYPWASITRRILIQRHVTWYRFQGHCILSLTYIVSLFGVFLSVLLVIGHIQWPVRHVCKQSESQILLMEVMLVILHHWYLAFYTCDFVTQWPEFIYECTERMLAEVFLSTWYENHNHIQFVIVINSAPLDPLLEHWVVKKESFSPQMDHILSTDLRWAFGISNSDTY